MVPYCGSAPGPVEWLTRWNFDPAVIVGLGLLQLAGLALPADGDRRRHLSLGTLSLALLFVSPLCALTSALFSARTVHHLLLVTVAAPLIAAALPQRRTVSLPLSLLVATLLFWVWHLPGLYTLALADSGLYWVMQLSLLGSAVLFWNTLRAAEPVSAVMALIAATVQMGLLGALLVFAPTPLYAPHLATTVAWGLGPLADQQLAGLLMWVPGMLPYLAVAALLSRRHWRAAVA